MILDNRTHEQLFQKTIMGFFNFYVKKDNGHILTISKYIIDITDFSLGDSDLKKRLVNFTDESVPKF